MPVPNVTPSQVSRLRQRPHRTRVWLSIYQPNTVLAAQISGAVAKGTRDIPISIVAGDPNSVVRGMTCYIGTTPGGRDKGRIRAISSTASALTLAENSVAWVNGWYLTVVAYYEPWSVFPRILLSNNVPIFYKDYDIAYTNQNQLMDPVVCMGPNHAGFLETGCHSVWYSSTGSFDPTDGARPTGWLWNFEGGMPTSSTQPDPGWVAYTGAGHYITSLLATTDSGKSLRGHRHVSIYTKPNEGPAFPILKWGVRSFDGSRDQGGYAVRLFVRETADFAKVAEGALVVLFTESWEGTVKTKAAAGAENRSEILFCGYVEDDSIVLNPESNVLEFSVASVTGIMQRLATYSCALDDVETPANWTQMNDMTIDKAVIHFLRWQSTILEIADYSDTGNGWWVQYADMGRGSLYEGSNGIIASALLGSMVADRQGKIWSETNVNMMVTGSNRTNYVGTGFYMTRQDWRRELSWTRQQDDALAYMELGGISYSGPSATGGVGAYLAGAPGDAAGYFGNVERTQGLVLTDQNQLNALCGLAYAHANAEITDLVIPMAGDYRIIDIAPQNRLLMNMAASENWRGQAWDAKPFIPQSISYEVRAADQVLLMDVTAREETHGPIASTVEIPVDPPYDDDDLPYWDIQFPPIMPFPGIFPPITPEPPSTETVFILNTGQLFRCDDIRAASPVWYEVSVPGGSYLGALTHFWLNLYNPLDQAFIWSHYTSVDVNQGPHGYLVSGLQGTTSSWTEIWGNTENARLTVGFQRRMNFVGQSRTLGYFIGAARRTTLGSPNPVAIKGSVGSWSIHNTTCPGGGFGTGDGGNMGHLGGTTLIAVGGGAAGRSNDLGVTWSNDDGPGGVRFCHSLASDGINCIWAHEDQSSPAYYIYHHAVGFNPGNTVYNVAVDIAPSVSGVRYDQAWATTDGSWHTYKSIINAGAYLYMMAYAPSIGNSIWFRKNSWLPTSLDWVPLYDWGNLYHLVGIDLSVLDTSHIVAMKYQGVVHAGTIVYSDDGGLTWTDKTANLASLGWNAGQPSTCKFSLSAAELA